MIISLNQHDHVTVTWSCWLREIIIDFRHTLSRGHVGYG
jgi:hypothetical protein